MANEMPYQVASTLPSLRSEIVALKQQFPALVSASYEVACCHGCAFLDIYFEHGLAVADAWDRIYSIMWLIGDV